MGKQSHPSTAGHARYPSEVSDGLLEDLIAAHLVLPNRMTVPVKKGLDVTNLRFPLPCVSAQCLLQGPGPRVRGLVVGESLKSIQCYA